MALADVAIDLSEPSSETLSAKALPPVLSRARHLKARALVLLLDQGVFEKDVYYETYLNLRYLGSDTSMMIMQPDDGNFPKAFEEEHRREFSFNLDKPILVDDIRVRGIGRSPELKGTGSGKFAKDLKTLHRFPVQSAQSLASQDVYFKQCSSGWVASPVYQLGTLEPGTVIGGPA